MSQRNGSDHTSMSNDGSEQELFRVHQISKMDTMAGLAIRYDVTVSDIKRSNSFLSESAMFARKTLLIPTRPLPMGNESLAWAGMIVTQFGQIDRGQERLTPSFANSSHGNGGDQRSSLAIDQLRAHYGLTPATSTGSGRMGSGSCDGLNSSQPGELEMQDLAGSSEHLPSQELQPHAVSYAGERNGPSFGDERLRRRQGCDTGDSWDGGGRATSGSSDRNQLSDSSQCPGHTGNGPMHSSSGFPASSSQLDSARNRSATATSPDRAHLSFPASWQPSAATNDVQARREGLLEKVKRVTSQPTLAISAVSHAAANIVARASEAGNLMDKRRPSSGLSDTKSQGSQSDVATSRNKPAKLE